MPYTGAPEFVGRDDDLKTLDDRLQESNLLAITAIQGMGGIGKTELALQYAYRSLAQDQFPGGVCWLRSREDLGTQIVGFARSQLLLQIREDVDLLEQVAQCWTKWRAGKALLIWDDVTDYAEIVPYLPPRGDRFQVLLTTRVDLGASVRQLRLEVLSEAAALDLLRAIVTQGGRVKDLRFLEEIGGLERQLCQWVGYLPLGLELVGRYLARRKEVSIATLLQRLQEKRLDAKALKQAEPGMTASLGVAAAFELSWQELKPSARKLAAWLSLFALAPIPWRLLQACLPEWDAEDLEDVRDEELLALHLLQHSEAGMYQLHQLLREFFAAKRQGMAIEEEMKQTLCQVMVAEAEQIPQTLMLDLIAQFTPLIPHLEEVTTALTDCLTDDDLITPYIRIARFYQGQAAYAQAQPWLEQCRATAETRLGETHPAVATSLNNLAGLYDSQGRYTEAEPLYARSLSIREQQLDSDHPDVATSLNNLAGLYQLQGRYAEAEPLLVRSLSIQEQQLGSDHPHVATSLNNLAELYRSQGRYAEAEPLYARSLSIREKQLGSDHPDVATSLNGLALLYESQGRYAEAEPLLVRSLSIQEQQLGSDHPSVATSLNNLALLYESQGRYAEAEPLLVRSLSIQEQQLGSDHPHVATSLNNLAELYRSQGRYAEAEPLYARSLSIREKQLGSDHPDVATSLNGLALLYESQGRYAEAEPLLVRSLSIQEQQLGSDHPSVATSLNNLALLYESQGRYAEAEPLLVRSLSIQKQQLGSDHPSVATSLNNLAALYRSQGRYAEAEPLYARSLSIREKQLGSDHPSVATSLNGLALLYESQGRYAEAEPLYARSVSISETQLGSDHPDVAISLNNLAVLYRLQGRYAEAEPLYLQALTIFFDRLGETHPNTQTVWQNFVGCLQQAIESGQTAQLSDHPLTQERLELLRRSG